MGTLAVVAAALMTASCASGSGTSADDSTTPPDSQLTPSVTEEPDGDSAGDSAGENTTTPPPTSSATTSVPASTVAPTTTASLPEGFVDETCEALRTEGYDSRKKALADVNETYPELDGVGALRARCDDALRRLDDAMVIEMRAAALSGELEDSVTMTNPTCVSGVATVDLTNITDHPLGARVTIAYTRGETDDLIATNSEPIVVWSLDPGASVTVEGSTIVDGGEYRCGFDIDLFDADPSDSDASLGTMQQPELTGDDPAIWAPAMIGYEVASDGTGKRDRAAVIEDVRSASYAKVINDIRFKPRNGSIETPVVTVCEQGRSGPDPDHISLVLRSDYPTHDPFLSHGIFRRGGDGQWRWLSSASTFVSAAYNDSCL